MRSICIGQWNSILCICICNLFVKLYLDLIIHVQYTKHMAPTWTIHKKGLEQHESWLFDECQVKQIHQRYTLHTTHQCTCYNINP